MQTSTIKSYLYQQYKDDLDLSAFVDAYNSMSQGYVDLFNTINLPIYTGLSGAMLDWVGAGVYGLARPTIGTPSGAVYNIGVYNQITYDAGSVGVLTLSDDIYKRCLTWKLHRGDGRYFNLSWLKRRLKRFLIGVNGTSPVIDNTYEIGVKITPDQVIHISINYPSDPASVTYLIECMTAGILDMPWQYQTRIMSV